MPLIVEVDFKNFVEKLNQHKLCGGVFYQVKEAPEIDVENRCMEKIRSYRV